MWRYGSLRLEGFNHASSLLINAARNTTPSRSTQWKAAIPLGANRRAYTSIPHYAPSPLAIALDSPSAQLQSVSTRRPRLSTDQPHALHITIQRLATARRWKSSSEQKSDKLAQSAVSAPKAELSPNTAFEQAQTTTTPSSTPLLDRLPHLPHLHRPTKEELLAAATGFWSRLKVRFKWFSIKSDRRFNIDDISGFLSWIFIGHLVWIIVGTTTFFSLAILTVNTVFAQETLAKWIGEYLTKSSGIQIVFESAIVPKWGDGVISFSNVFVSRRPGQGKTKVVKGSQAQIAAAANAERGDPVSNVPVGDDDGNYTQFDVSIDSVNVTLSFAKWFNGKGPLRDVEMRGVRGVVDRTHVRETDVYLDPKSYRREHNPGDFELDSFKLEDLLVTIYQPNKFRPFSMSIFSCDLPQLRQQWLFYDFMSANNISGSIDNSLFTLHPRQSHSITGMRSGELSDDGTVMAWKKRSRLRIDGLNIDHLNRGVDGPFSWIREGSVDIIADIAFPAEDDDSVAKIMSDVFDRVEATVTTNSIPELRANHSHLDSESKINHAQGVDENGTTSDENGQHTSDDDDRFLIMDLRIHMNDVRAAVPIFTKDISYVNNALIRPIVAYINSRRALIPVNCRVVKRKSEFDGSWTLFDSGMLDDMNREVSSVFSSTQTDANCDLGVRCICARYLERCTSTAKADQESRDLDYSIGSSSVVHWYGR